MGPLGVRQSIADDSPNEAAEDARQERGALGRARAAPQYASARDHRDYNADQGPHEIRHRTPVFARVKEHDPTIGTSLSILTEICNAQHLDGRAVILEVCRWPSWMQRVSRQTKHRTD